MDSSNNTWAKLGYGELPGRISAIRQWIPASLKKPAFKPANKPARASEDLPQPEGPTIARNRVCPNFSNS